MLLWILSPVNRKGSPQGFLLDQDLNTIQNITMITIIITIIIIITRIIIIIIIIIMIIIIIIIIMIIVIIIIMMKNFKRRSSHGHHAWLKAPRTGETHTLKWTARIRSHTDINTATSP